MCLGYGCLWEKLNHNALVISWEYTLSQNNICFLYLVYFHLSSIICTTVYSSDVVPNLMFNYDKGQNEEKKNLFCT